MSDLIDDAQGAEMRARAIAVSAVQAKLTCEGAEHCDNCGSAINAARRMAVPSAIRCLECQDAFERGYRGKCG